MIDIDAIKARARKSSAYMGEDAQARRDVAHLVAEVERLTAERDAIRAAAIKEAAAFFRAKFVITLDNKEHSIGPIIADQLLRALTPKEQA